MQSENPLVADVVKLANAAAGTLAGMTREARDTKSSPPSASFIRSRAPSRASRVIPASVPAAALASLTKSATRGFSLCMAAMWSRRGSLASG